VLPYNNSLYLVDAQLSVQQETEYYKAQGGAYGVNNEGCPADADPKLGEFAEVSFIELLWSYGGL